jgi:hypothetical protein
MHKSGAGKAQRLEDGVAFGRINAMERSQGGMYKYIKCKPSGCLDESGEKIGMEYSGEGKTAKRRVMGGVASQEVEATGRKKAAKEEGRRQDKKKKKWKQTENDERRREREYGGLVYNNTLQRTPPWCSLCSVCSVCSLYSLYR